VGVSNALAHETSISWSLPQERLAGKDRTTKRQGILNLVDGNFTGGR